MPEEYNPNSVDAVLARIETNQKNTLKIVEEMHKGHTAFVSKCEQDKEEINRRVTILENAKAKAMGVAATVGALGAGAWKSMSEFFSNNP